MGHAVGVNPIKYEGEPLPIWLYPKQGFMLNWGGMQFLMAFMTV